MFVKDHNRKNWFVINTARGYYAAFIAGSLEFRDEAGSARLFASKELAEGWWLRSQRRAKAMGRTMPELVGIEKHKTEFGVDQNR